MRNVETVTLPGLIDMHVHARDFAQMAKEDFTSCSIAALAGGVTLCGIMPNFEPEMKIRPYTWDRMRAVQRHAVGKIYNDFTFFAASQPKYDNVGKLEQLLPMAVGTKWYVEVTQGNDTVQVVQDFRPAAVEQHRVAPRKPIVAHVEDNTIEEAIGMVAQDIQHPLHIPHVNTRFMLDAIIKAKDRGLPVTSEVCPHHLFMTQDYEKELGWYARMKPRLGTLEDVEYLWAKLDKIDTFGTDHAPHAKAEKEEAERLNPEGKTGEKDKKVYGVPGLEAMLPLLLNVDRTGYVEGIGIDVELTRDDIVHKTNTRPRQIFNLPAQRGTKVEVMLSHRRFGESDIYSKCEWSPYIGRAVTGRIMSVTLNGAQVFANGKITGRRPEGRVVIPELEAA